MADDELTAEMTLIRAREEAATRGPWLADVLTDGGDRPVVILPDPGDGDGADLLFSADAPYVTEADAEFVAHARADVPRLLAAVEKVLDKHQPGPWVILGALCMVHEPGRYFSILDSEAARIRDCQDCAATLYKACTGCANGVGFEACGTRKAITTALTGEGTADASR